MCWCPHADEDFGGDVEIPEEVQAQLLEDYERECEENSRKKSITGNGKLAYSYPNLNVDLLWTDSSFLFI